MSVQLGEGASHVLQLPVETEYRVLVPDAHVGSIIGHNGDLIRKNRAETGASVKVFSSTPGRSDPTPESILAPGLWVNESQAAILIL